MIFTKRQLLNEGRTSDAFNRVSTIISNALNTVDEKEKQVLDVLPNEEKSKKAWEKLADDLNGYAEKYTNMSSVNNKDIVWRQYQRTAKEALSALDPKWESKYGDLKRVLNNDKLTSEAVFNTVGRMLEKVIDGNTAETDTEKTRKAIKKLKKDLTTVFQIVNVFNDGKSSSSINAEREILKLNGLDFKAITSRLANSSTIADISKYVTAMDTWLNNEIISNPHINQNFDRTAVLSKDWRGMLIQASKEDGEESEATDAIWTQYFTTEWGKYLSKIENIKNIIYQSIVKYGFTVSENPMIQYIRYMLQRGVELTQDNLGEIWAIVKGMDDKEFRDYIGMKEPITTHSGSIFFNRELFDRDLGSVGVHRYCVLWKNAKEAWRNRTEQNKWPNQDIFLYALFNEKISEKTFQTATEDFAVTLNEDYPIRKPERISALLKGGIRTIGNANKFTDETRKYIQRIFSGHSDLAKKVATKLLFDAYVSKSETLYHKVVDAFNISSATVNLSEIAEVMTKLAEAGVRTTPDFRKTLQTLVFMKENGDL